MKFRELSRLFTIILIILLLSLVIGNVVITPILAYHKLLVRFFGWFFLIMTLLLIFLKFYSNYRFVLDSFKNEEKKAEIIKKTVIETMRQISIKLWNFSSMISFLIMIAAIALLFIWINSQLIRIPVY